METEQLKIMASKRRRGNIGVGGATQSTGIVVIDVNKDIKKCSRSMKNLKPVNNGKKKRCEGKGKKCY